MKPYVFEQKRQVQPDDLDVMQHVNNVRYVQWIQDVAEAHWRHQAPDDMQQQFVWVVLSHFIEYKNPVFLPDDVQLRTYVGEASGPKYDRFVEIWKPQEEKLCVKAKSVWCLLDAQTQRPKRVTNEIRQIFEEPS
uniref:Thioesterase family protein n=1 Tax=Roseihalotalea indica TaxID=2867963 RepID=A0AA49GRV5_9BACT|nr:thioesterase family protein [Tunicatimonas sp. TK19036]